MKMMAVREQREMSSEDESQVSGDLRRGPWSVEEDLLLVNYIAAHGEGQWNALARCAGLKRTGKSCRLRWLNYLRPDLRRGNFTAQEQLLILELHSRWGNRWSRIAQHLPGRTDNEIKNYWRTRVQKHARQLNCDVNSQQFRDLVRYLWIPRLLERIHLSGSSSPPDATPPSQLQQFHHFNEVELSYTTAASSSSSVSTDGMQQQQQQPPLVSQPEMVSAAEGNCWSTCTDNDNNNNDSMKKSSTSLRADTWCQPPNASTTECYNPAQYLGASETCWSSVVPADPFSTGVYAADMAPLLPDLGETMWGADDLWYTQIMGL